MGFPALQAQGSGVGLPLPRDTPTCPFHECEFSFFLGWVFGPSAVTAWPEGGPPKGFFYILNVERIPEPRGHLLVFRSNGCHGGTSFLGPLTAERPFLRLWDPERLPHGAACSVPFLMNQFSVIGRATSL